MSSGFLLSFLGAWTGLSLYILGGFGNARTARPALFAAGIGMFLSSIRSDGLPLVWPILSGWEWLLAASLLWLGVQLLKVSGRTRLGPIFPLLASIVFAIPAWTTRDEASLLVGHVPIAFPQGVGVLAAISLVGGGWRWLRSSPVGLRVSRGLMVYGLLGLGTLVFSIPFFWLLLTSFKEERDMTNANGLVWVPRVTRTMQAFDPLSPLYETTYQGMPVQVEKRATEPGGIRVSVVRPGSVAGTSLVVPDSALKEVPREMKVVRTRDAQGEMEGLLLDEDGVGAHVKILEPASRAGQIVVMPTQAVEPVRDVGLLWRNYSDALAALPAEAEGGWRYLRNTLFLCVMCVLGTVLSCTVVAYGFARLRFPGRNFLFGVLLATMMLPGAVTMLPSFLIFRELGWVDSLTPLWAPAFLGSAFNIFLLRQFFLTLPRELEDAAKIDGCGYGRTLWSVMAPQIKPALVVVAIWTFIGAWNNFMGPLIYVNSSEKMTIAYAMQLFAGDKSNQPGLLMAFATMALLPIVILFFLAQRAFVEGIALTGRTG